MIPKFSYFSSIAKLRRQFAKSAELVAANLFYRKRPKGENYHYEVLDPLRILGEETRYAKTFLVGENWERTSDAKPIALMYGFNDWKYGFVSSYLKEYRTAFLQRKTNWLKFALLLQRLEIKPGAIIIWGTSDNWLVRWLANFRKITIYRMEDGFVRSSDLGAAHSTPYSLVLDKTGLYYDARESSDIENILNNYEKYSKSLTKRDINETLNFVIQNNITKYNPASLNKPGISTSIRTRKVVAVIGQVNSDASIRYGNPDSWTMEELVQLARQENPDADVIYRPHPEIFKGFQKGKINRKRVEYFAKIVSPEESMIDFLNSVDHVYTISSTAGIEAIIRNIKVTVVGAPFYAGWGVTDDRTIIERRSAKRTVEELFAAAYLIYPRYLADPENAVLGLKAACLRIVADSEVAKFQLYNSIDIENPSLLSEKLRSDYWPQLLFSTKSHAVDDFEKKIDSIPFYKSLNGNPGRLFQMVFLYSICGKLTRDVARNRFLKSVRKYIDIDVLNNFLLDLAVFHPGAYVYEHVSWLLAERQEYTYSVEVAMAEFEKIQAQKALAYVMSSEEDQATPQQNVSPLKIEYSPEQVGILNSMFDTHLEFKRFAEAIDVAKRLMLTGNASSLMFLRLAEIGESTFDSKSAQEIARFQQKFGLLLHNRGALHIELENSSTEVSDVVKQGLLNRYALQMKTNPDRINRSWAIFKSYFRDASFYHIFRSMLNLDNDQIFQKALAFLEIDSPERARSVIEYLVRNGEASDKISIVYSKILFALGEHTRALNIISRAMQQQPTHENYTEKLRMLKALGRFDESYDLIIDANIKKLDFSLDGHAMPVYFGLKRIKEGFQCYLESTMKDNLIKYFGKEKYKHTESLAVKNLFLLCYFGPAEEVRFASIYNELAQKLGVENFKLACDSRLLRLFERSFPSIQFVPIRRTRFFTPDTPRQNYDRLPAAELREVLDNNGLEVVERSSEIVLWAELIWQFRQSYADFHGKPYLQWDKGRENQFRARLPKTNKLVGLCWRSSLTNSMRNIHYLTIQQLAPIFELEGITFVNLQYDDCVDDLAWVERHYPGKIIDFAELDQFNDFDGVASLMACLDLVVSPLSAPIELAGGLGCKAILFTNHGEAWWREVGENKTDVWFESVRHIRTTVGDKNGLVLELKQELQRWLAT